MVRGSPPPRRRSGHTGLLADAHLVPDRGDLLLLEEVVEGEEVVPEVRQVVAVELMGRRRRGGDRGIVGNFLEVKKNHFSFTFTF